MLQPFAHSELTRAIHVLQACGFYAPIPFFKLAANMRFHYHIPSLRPTCANTIAPLAVDTHHLHLSSSPPPCAKIIFSATEARANMRRQHLSSLRPTSASLPCNILLRRMPFTRPAPVTPPFSPRLPGDNHPTPPAPSAKPPILRPNDLRHRLEHRRARRWPLASSIFLSTATVLLSRPVSKLASRSGNLYGYRPTDQARLKLASRSGNLTTNPGHTAISLPAATFDIRRTLLAHHDDILFSKRTHRRTPPLPRRYRRSSAHNFIKCCAAFFTFLRTCAR